MTMAGAGSGSSAPNRVRSVHFWAAGMTPYTLDVDHLTAAPARVLLHLKITLPQPGDSTGAVFDAGGITSAVAFERHWAMSAKCQTKGWAAGRVCVSQELGPISEACADMGVAAGPPAGTGVDGERVLAYLPESALSRCQWMDRSESRLLIFFRLASATAARVPAWEAGLLFRGDSLLPFPVAVADSRWCGARVALRFAAAL